MSLLQIVWKTWRNSNMKCSIERTVNRKKNHSHLLFLQNKSIFAKLHFVNLPECFHDTKAFVSTSIFILGGFFYLFLFILKVLHFREMAWMGIRWKVTTIFQINPFLWESPLFAIFLVILQLNYFQMKTLTSTQVPRLT